MHASPAVDASWPELHRERRAIVVADVVESVRLMQQHEADVIDRWRRFVHEVRTQLLPRHGGRLVKSLGDGLLLEFDAVPAAVAAALDLHTRIAALNSAHADGVRLALRVGVHLADVVVDALDVYGAGVNLAARLAQLADPGGTVVSAPVRDQVAVGLDADIEDLGDCYLKHVDEPVRAYRIASPTPGGPAWFPTAAVPSLRPTVAVIPFDTHDAGGASVFMGDAVADEIIAWLSRHPDLAVISRLSTTMFRGRRDALAGIHTHLRADYVLDGAVHVSGDRLRLVVELTEVASATVVWAGTAQGSVHAVFSGDDPLAGDIANHVCEALSKRQVERSRREPMAALESYCLLIAAATLMHGSSRPDFERARVMLDHLVERDRRHPAPHAWLAKWHVLRVQQGWSADMRQDTLLALDCTRRALDADPRSSLSLAIDGFVHSNLLKDFDGALARHELALSENPSEPLAWLFLGLVNAFQGKGAEALQAAERGLALSPLDPMRYFFESLTATASLAAQQWENTVALARRSLRLNRSHTSTLRALAIAQVQLGRMDEARATVRSLLQLEPQLTIRSYLARSPASAYPTGRLWSESLAAAGVPQG